MGNYASCAMAGSPSIKVVFPSGEVRTFKESVNAAELMLETPNHFLVNTRSLEMGRRFSPLNAEEDLSMNQLYVLFPMKKLNSIISASDMSGLFLAAKKKSNSNSKSKVVPLIINVEDDSSEKMIKLEDMAEELNLPQFGHRRMDMVVGFGVLLLFRSVEAEDSTAAHYQC